MISEFIDLSSYLIANIPVHFQRSLHEKINWDDRLIGIKGSRGTGKTTLLLQWLKSQQLPPNRALYLSLDDLYFTSQTLIDTAMAFYHQGGEILVLDEVHKYVGWSREIKNLYDRYPKLKILFTGSSIIDIARQESDLSRRVMMYELQGLSYREFLAFQKDIHLPVFQLNQILNPDNDLRKSFPPAFRPLAYFEEYLKSGYYPFAKEYPETYADRLRQLTRTIVEYDMAELKGFDIRQAKKMLQLVYLIAQQVPFKPNIQSLAEKTKLHRNTIPNYLHFLNEARLISLLYPPGKSIAILQKPEKIYLQNTNLLYALSETLPSIGTIREVFFHNQLSQGHRLHYSTITDFEADGKIYFEIGGKGKSNNQIRNLKEAWVVKDDIEFSAGTTLPLWIFGFLY